MAIDTSTPRSRRALMAGLAGGLAAAVAGGLGRAQPASAHDADDVRLGRHNSATSTTSITNTAANDIAFRGTAEGFGVWGHSPLGTGVYGSSHSGYGVGGSSYAAGVFGISFGTTEGAAGVIGRSSGDRTGVFGSSGTGSLLGGPAKTGVYGYAAKDASAKGVWGKSTSGRGGVFTGKVAQVRLTPSSAISHPTSGAKGDLFVDTSGRLWFCKGGATWVQLA
jgi:hypothetical protein